jgi:ABC-type dipeptide/oligopeptide/nickel transport system permease subunit
MLAEARPFMRTAPWLIAAPGVCIALVLLGVNLFGDGLRDALDPRMRGVES